MKKQFTFHFNNEDVKEHYEHDDGNSTRMFALTDKQLYGIIHNTSEILCKKNLEMQNDGSLAYNILMYIPNIVRYMTDPELITLNGFKKIVDQNRLEELMSALKTIDDIMNF